MREAISNVFAKATEIRLAFETEADAGETIFVIRSTDNESGMNRDELQSFLDLGNSTRRGNESTIGEKGHGTKVYFNATKVVVDTQREGIRFIATLDAPFAKSGASRFFPQAQIVFDRFHLMQMAGQAADQVRKELARTGADLKGALRAAWQ